MTATSVRDRRPLVQRNAFETTDLTTIADQRLTSPSIDLLTGMKRLTLRNLDYRSIEQNGAGALCNGVILDVDVADGAFAGLGVQATGLTNAT